MANNIYKKFPGLKRNVLLKKFTTYKIGGPAKYFLSVRTKEELLSAIKLAKSFRLPIFILGGGSNLLISDKGFNGLVIKIDINSIDFYANSAVVGAGASLIRLAGMSAEKELSGLEWAAGIPGTVGGAIYGHAQAFGVKISKSVKEVEALDMKDLKMKTFSNKQCRFTLKNSIFKKNKNLVIISAVLEFEKKNGEEIKNKLNEFLNYRKTRHPINFPSAGSTFVNPEKEIKNKKLLEKYPEIIEFNKNGIIPAGYLIQRCGLSGKKIGEAQISEKHANFIVNLGGAKAKCVIGLMRLAKRKVKKTFGINLEPEVQFIGFKTKQ